MPYVNFNKSKREKQWESFRKRGNFLYSYSIRAKKTAAIFMNFSQKPPQGAVAYGNIQIARFIVNQLEKYQRYFSPAVRRSR